MPDTICADPYCSHTSWVRGLCKLHYAEWRRTHREKRCMACKLDKPYDDFPPNIRRNRLHGEVCNECTEHTKTLQARIRIRQSQLRKQGLTADAYLAMRAAQEDCCAICGRHESVLPNLVGTWKRLVIDHDHITGQVRGLLCNHCNRGLGSFYDSPTSLRNAIRYLQGKHRKPAQETPQIPLFNEKEGT